MLFMLKLYIFDTFSINAFNIVGLSPNFQDVTGEHSPISYAIQSDNIQIVKSLIRHGLHVIGLNGLFKTPLMRAMENKGPNSIDILKVVFVEMVFIVVLSCVIHIKVIIAFT